MLNETYESYKSLVGSQTDTPTKKQIVELRKALLCLKKECDLQRRILLNKPMVKTVKPKVVEPVEVKVEPVEPVESVESVEVKVDVSSSEQVKEIKIKKKRK